jgi:hypothetical protein
MSISNFKNFSAGYTPGSPLTGKGNGRRKRKGGKGEGIGRRRVGDEGYRAGRREGMG